MKIPCPHFDIEIVSRGKGRSVIVAAAYQSGETLFSQYTGTWESGDHEERIVHKEILLPPNAPREYADQQTLWNAVDASEDSPNAQTARRLIIALPKELTLEQNIELIRLYCQTTFVDKGMIADIAVHFDHKDPPNPHAHILLTMRAISPIRTLTAASIPSLERLKKSLEFQNKPNTNMTCTMPYTLSSQTTAPCTMA